MDELLRYFMEHYLPKEEVMYRLSVSLSIDEFWPRLLERRREQAVVLPLKAWDGQPYWYVPTQKLLAAADRFVAVARDDAVAALPQYAREEGVMDEAYYSSVIEGAYSTRARARELLRAGEAPVDRSERMIYNNYAALRFVLEQMDGPINEAVILEIARILTQGTLEEGTRGGYRDGPVQVISGRQEVVYVPPEARYVRPMMAELIAYINDASVHPLIKANVAHIYLVTVHPFFDGNGRTARALSYMILLRAGYNFIRQEPISGILAQERAAYYRAIRAAQNPENGYDLTYFMEYYTGMLSRSIEGIHARVAGMQRVEALRHTLGEGEDDARLLRGASWLVREEIPTITAEKWRNKFHVSFETARQDLLRLESAGFVRKRVVGRKHFFDLVGNPQSSQIQRQKASTLILTDR